jgi:hypothetical protein
VLLLLLGLGGCGSGGIYHPRSDTRAPETGASRDARSDGFDLRPADGAADTAICGGTVCDDALACTEDLCEASACVHRVRDGFCLIDGACHNAGDRREPGSCAGCDPQVSQSAWTDDSTVCPGGGPECMKLACQSGSCTVEIDTGFCVVDSTCVKNGEKDPLSDCRVCDTAKSSVAFQPLTDGSPCTADVQLCTDDVCQQGTCAHPLKAGSCLIEGACHFKDEPHPGADCRACDPSKSVSDWSDRPEGSPCTPDTLTCTSDLCAAGSCTHPLQADACLIGGACYAAKAPQPGVECHGCVPSSSTSSWTVLPDNAPCAAEAFTCTDDRCSGGTCSHPLKTGSCLIAGACYADGASVGAGTSCTICAAATAAFVPTYAEGKPCDDGSADTALDLCISGSCRGLGGYAWEWLSSDTGTIMTGVAPVPGSGGTWAVGQYTTSLGASEGFVARLNKSYVPSSLSWASQPLYGIHHRMAVGESGEVQYYDGTDWLPPPQVSSYVGLSRLNGVWGATTSSGQFFYLARDWGLGRCITTDGGGSFTCVDQSGPAVSDMVRVFGTVSGSALGPLWALQGSGYEDIYFNPGTGVSWSTAAPQGCFDSATSPCGNTSGRFQDLFAASASDVWAVGEAGLVMHYDGTAWTQVAIPSLQGAPSDPPQSAYNFRAVFAQGDVVLLAGDRNFFDQYHDLVVVTYNGKLKKWFAPQLMFYTTWSDPHRTAYRIRDAGGPSLDELYLVGSIWDQTPGVDEQRALFVTLP